MDVQFTHVQPGDLITSDLFNRLLDAFNDLNARLIVLEVSGSIGDVAILGLVPNTGIVRLGDQLTVVGYGFGLSVGGCRAFIDDVAIGSFLAGSNDEQLIFTVPLQVANAFPVPPTGRSGTLVVRGPRGQAKRDLTLLPPQAAPPGGMGVQIAFLDASPNPIAANQSAKFRFNATSIVSAPIIVTPTVTFQGVANPAVWQAASSFAQADGTTLLPGGTINLKGGEVDHTFTLVVAVPTGTEATAVSFVVNLISNDAAPVTGSSSVMSFTVGQAPPAPDPNFSAKVNAALPTTALQGSTIVLAPNKSMTLKILVTITKAGNYFFDDPTSTGTGWTVKRTSDKSFTAATDSPAPQLVTYTVQSGATLTDGKVTFPFRRDGSAASPTTIVLQLKQG